MSFWYTSSCPVLHFYQASSKYSKGFLGYRTDKKYCADADADSDADANGVRPKNSEITDQTGAAGIDLVLHCPHKLRRHISHIAYSCRVVSVLDFGSQGSGFESHCRQNSVHESSWFYGTSLPRAFHYHTTIVSIWLTECWKGCKTPNNHHHTSRVERKTIVTQTYFWNPCLGAAWTPL